MTWCILMSETSFTRLIATDRPSDQCPVKQATTTGAGAVTGGSLMPRSRTRSGNDGVSSGGDPPGRPPAPPDWLLVERCLGGDGRAWALLVNRYEALVFTTARRSGLRADEAEDVMQDVFYILMNCLCDLRDVGRIGGWLATTTRREAWRKIRNRPQVVESELEPGTWEALLGAAHVGDDSTSPEAVLQKLQDRVLVDEALERVGGDCKRLLRTLFGTNEPLSYQEISAKLNMPVGSIGPTRRRCLERLARILAEIGF